VHEKLKKNAIKTTKLLMTAIWFPQLNRNVEFLYRTPHASLLPSYQHVFHQNNIK